MFCMSLEVSVTRKSGYYDIQAICNSYSYEGSCLVLHEPNIVDDNLDKTIDRLSIPLHTVDITSMVDRPDLSEGDA